MEGGRKKSCLTIWKCMLNSHPFFFITHNNPILKSVGGLKMARIQGGAALVNGCIISPNTLHWAAWHSWQPGLGTGKQKAVNSSPVTAHPNYTNIPGHSAAFPATTQSWTWAEEIREEKNGVTRMSRHRVITAHPQVKAPHPNRQINLASERCWE